MRLKHFVIVSILGFSSFAFADNTATTTTSTDNQRMWTILASQNHDEHAQDKKTVADPGVLVNAQRDPHDKK